MYSIHKTKLVSITPPAAIVDNAALTCNVVDTQGYKHLRIIAYGGATDIAMATLKVQESDTKSNTTTLTSGADITGLIFGTSANIDGSTSAVPSSTDDNTFAVMDIDLRGRKRYILPVATEGDGAAGAYRAILGILSDGELAPVTMSECGCDEILRV